MDRDNQPRSRFWIIVLIGMILVTVAHLTPSPFLVQRPGPVLDLFGEAAQTEGSGAMMSIQGADDFDPQGTLSLLSVTTSGNPDHPLSWLSLVRPLLNPTQSIVPLSSVFPEGLTADERSERSTLMMSSSQESAIAAAMAELGEPVSGTVTVRGVAEEGASLSILEPGDVIVSANGREIESVEELRLAVSAGTTGDAVQLEILRDGVPHSVSIVPEVPTGGEDPRLGITAETEFEFDIDVAMEVDDIGGPSAGLVFALAVYASLAHEDLTGGEDISGTGTIDALGRVGPIGGLEQKLWGAQQAGSDLVLVPLANCSDLPSRLPDGVVVAPVATLTEAIEVLRAFGAGEQPAGIERCASAAASVMG